MHNIHVFVPPYKDNQGFIPVAQLWFKTYYQKHGKNADKIKWVTPIVNWTEELLWQQILDNPPSVWGFGGYIWNINLCYRMAKRVKETFPNCLVVAGGPQPEYKHDQDFFKKHPYIDLVVPGDGEIPFTDIIDEYLGNQDYMSCREVIVPSNEGWTKSTRTYNILLDWEWPEDFISSNRREILGLIDQYRITNKDKSVFFLYETMKGCPYECVFCDWGGGIHTKVRQKNVEEIKKDIDELSNLGIQNLGFSDANFGILKRDIEIAKFVIEKGTFSSVFYHPAKNNKKRVMELTKLFFEAGLLHMHHIDLQDFNDFVLKNIRRFEIPWEKHIQYVRELTETTGVNTVTVNTLLGLPGQTMKTLIADVDQFGKHNFGYSRYSKWLMLPNSPGNDPAYREEFKIKTKKTYAPPWPAAVKPGINRFFGDATITYDTNIVRDSACDIVVESSTFTQAEYLEMIHFVATVYSCQVNGLLTMFTHGLYHLKGIPYSKFYERFFYEFLPQSQGKINRLHENLKATLEKNIQEDIFDLGIENPDFGEKFPFYFLPDMYLLSGHAWNSHELYDQLIEWLGPELDEQSMDLLHYNRNIFLSPDYDSTVGRKWTNNYDWFSWFKKNFSGVTLDKISEGPEKCYMVYEATDTTTSYTFGDPLPIEWHNHDLMLEKLMDYFYKVCYGTKNYKILEKVKANGKN